MSDHKSLKLSQRKVNASDSFVFHCCLQDIYIYVCVYIYIYIHFLLLLCFISGNENFHSNSLVILGFSGKQPPVAVLVRNFDWLYELCRQVSRFLRQGVACMFTRL